MTILFQRFVSDRRLRAGLLITAISAYGLTAAAQRAKSPDGQKSDVPDVIRPGDWLSIEVSGTLPGAPIKDVYRVEPSGKVALGTEYGRVQIEGKTLEQAEKIVGEYLASLLREANVQITRYDPALRPPRSAIEALERRVAKLETNLRPAPRPAVTDTSLMFLSGEAAGGQPASAKPPDLIHTIAGSWTVIDPDKDCEVRVIGDKLSITVPAANHDLSGVRGLNAPRALKKVNGDFIVQVKVTADFKPGTTSTGKGQPFNGAGIVLWQNEENFLRVERNAFWIGEKLYCYPPIMEYWHNREYSGANNDLIGADYFKGRSTWLKVNRQGKNIAVSISHDGKQWSDVKAFPVELADELFVGVDALNTSDTAFTVDFEELIIKSE